METNMKYVNMNQDFDKLNAEYNDPKKPYRYLAIDNFLNEDACDKFSASFPDVSDSRWFKFDDRDLGGKKNPFEKGMYGIAYVEDLPEFSYNIIKELTSDLFVDYLKRITGHDDLINDTHREIGQWAGIRMTSPGGYQGIHSDARLHPFLGIEKKLTLVGYLNKDWKPEDSGETEVWTDDMKSCVDKVEPIYNRIFIFENTAKSYHGVPEVNNWRKSFLTSYLSNEPTTETRPKAEFVKRPGENVEGWDELSKTRANLTDY